MIGTGKHGDAVATCNGPAHADGSHEGFGSGIAESDPVLAGEFADQFGDLPGDGAGGPDFIAFVELLFDRLYDKGGFVSEKSGSKTMDDVDPFMTVDVIEVGTFTPVRDGGKNHLLPQRIESAHGARIGENRPVLLGEPACFGILPDVVGDEFIEVLPLARR